MTFSYLIIAILFAVCESRDNPTVKAHKLFYEKLNDKNQYEKTFSPKLGESGAVEVGVTMYALKLDLSDKNKELNVDIYFRQKWTDDRLASSDSASAIIGRQELADKLWIPDSFFSSSSHVKSNKYPTPNIFVKVSPNGEVFLSQRFQTTVDCAFPSVSEISGDVNCTLDIESYGYNANDIVYKWDKGIKSIGVSSRVSNNEYTFRGFDAKSESVVLSTGNYSRLLAEFSFLKNEIKPQIAAGLVSQSIDY